MDESNTITDHDFLNETEDGLEYVYDYTDESNIYKIYTDIFTLVSVFCIALNILVAFLMFRYRRLRKDKSNLILAHWCIVNSLFMLSSPVTLRAAISWTYYGEASATFFCIVEQSEYTFLFCNILQMVLLTFYWYYKLFDRVKFEKYIRNFNFFLGLVYVMSVFCIAVHFDVCYNRRYYTASEFVLFVTYLVYIIFMIVINILSFIKMRGIEQDHKRNIPMIITNTFFCAILPTLFMIFIGMSIVVEPVLLVALFSTAMILSVSNPIYFFFVLYRYHEDFRTFFKHVLTCECTKYNDEELMENPVVFNNETESEENKC